MSKFEPGKSGNVAGRPKGIQDKRTALKHLFALHAEALIAKVIELAMAGDVTALKICIDRVAAKAKSEHITFSLPFNDAKNVKELLDNNAAIIAAAADGKLSLEQAQIISEMLETRYKFIVSSEIEQRLKNIEIILKEKHKNNEKY